MREQPRGGGGDRRRDPTRPPRIGAIERLARLVPEWPDLPFTERGEGGLSDAIVQEAVRRWRTLDWIIGTAMEREPASIEPPLHAALLAGAAQLVFMDQPDHAVVDETVEWCKRAIRDGAGRLANAVLRRIASCRGDRVEQAGLWWLEHNLLPMSDGSALRLKGVLLPEAPVQLIGVATSHADLLIRRWVARHGEDGAAAIAAHALAEAPRIVADPEGVLAAAAAPVEAHAQKGFVLWKGSLVALREAMARWPSLRVQDPGSAAAVERTRGMKVNLVVDACAGRGTKTRQLAALHPQAQIIASDIDFVRRRDLRSAMRDLPNVRVMDPPEVLALRGVDLLVLDVPCSNTGVLARRPEAKGRFDEVRLASLLALQRSIVDAHVPLLAPTGRLLHVTCSLEPEELEAAIARADPARGRRSEVEMHLPSGGPGAPASWHRDGGGSVLI